MKKIIPGRTMIERTIGISISSFDEKPGLPQSPFSLCGKENASSTGG
jgi:hypothetical protein